MTSPPSPRIAYPDLDGDGLVAALEAVHLHPGDAGAAHLAARELFASPVAVPAVVAGRVLSSTGPWARLCRRGLDAGDPRRERAAGELRALGETAHGDLRAALEIHGLADTLPHGDPADGPAAPPAFAALRDRMAREPDWGALVDRIADFHAAEGIGALATSRVLRFGPDGLVPVPDPDPGALGDLIGGGVRRAPLERAMAAFTAGGPPVDALLYGAPGTGKSVTVRALAAAHRDRGLRLVQLDRDRVGDLAAVFAVLGGRGPRCIVLLDDLVFDEGARTDRVLRAALEGDAAARPGNVAVWATSNRMKLLHETRSDREDDLEDALGRGERAALATRFALRVGFTAVEPPEFTAIALGLARRRGVAPPPDAEARAMRWARERGLTPRAARQFAEMLASEAVLAAEGG